MNARRAVLVLVPALVATALVGCTLTQSALRKGAELSSIGSGGRLVTPKRYRLDVVFLTRPQGDRVLNEVVWQVADEQVVEPGLRRALQLNGLRYGRITGDLPSELNELLQAGPPDRPQGQVVINPSGTPTLLDPTQAPPRPSLTLLLSQPDGSVKGKAYQDARGLLRLTPSHNESGGIAVRILPELHHGPVTAGFGVLPTAGLPAPQEFRMTSGQKEETFRDLAASLDLQPGQVALLGVRPERPGSLGDVLFQRPDGNSDRVLQTLVLLRAQKADAPMPSPSSSPAGLTPAEPPADLVPIDPIELTRTGG